MKFAVRTKGHYDFVDITERVVAVVEQSGIMEGIATVFVPGSTAALTTMEFEAGSIEDLKALLESLAPENADYHHHRRWGDRNGAAHIKSALIGVDLVIPIERGKLILGTWQQIVLIDFDERARQRDVFVKVVKG
jgi:secondary thiamine-phosphate synthase enzyme